MKSKANNEEDTPGGVPVPDTTMQQEQEQSVKLITPPAVEVPVWSKEALPSKGNETTTTPGEDEAGAATTTTDPNSTDPVNVNVNTVDLASMKDAVYFLFPDRNQRLTRFWMLLILAAVIATSGIVADSAATVIGAMIVAPLMTPILGTMLAIVLTDGPNFGFSFFLAISGMASCIFVGYIYGLCLNQDIIEKENNSQVAGRVQPKLPDLVGAIATGVVGSIALVRKDIAGALPGVAISISLVPPLCVAGLMGSIGELVDMAGALLLFITNFMSIQVTGIIVMYAYNVHKMATRPRAKLFRIEVFILVVLLGLVAVPLTFTSRRIAAELEAEQCVKDVTNDFLKKFNSEWECSVVIARTEGNKLTADVVATGPPPIPQLKFEQMGTLMFEDVDGWPYLIDIKEQCPNVSFISITYHPRQSIPVDEL